MRPILPGDLQAATLRLLALPQASWADEAATLVRKAEVADRYRQRLGRAHIHFGDGSLMAAAALAERRDGLKGQTPGWCHEPYLRALAVVLDALAAHRNRSK